jgi:predicted DNA-binding transcriptional regulator AlpA
MISEDNKTEAINKLVRKRLISVEDAALYLGLSPRTIYNGIAPKAKTPFPIRPKRYGKRRLFDIKDLNAWADSLPYTEDEGGTE